MNSWFSDFQPHFRLSKLCPNRCCRFSHLSAIDPWLYKEIPFAAKKCCARLRNQRKSSGGSQLITTYYTVRCHFEGKRQWLLIMQKSLAQAGFTNHRHRHIRDLLACHSATSWGWCQSVVFKKHLYASHDHLTNRATSTLKIGRLKAMMLFPTKNQAFRVNQRYALIPACDIKITVLSPKKNVLYFQRKNVLYLNCIKLSPRSSPRNLSPSHCLGQLVSQ